jgi:Flp pilus assembly pilin Flp
MVAAIAAVIVGVVFGLGTLVQRAFHKTCVAISNSDTTQTAGGGTAANCT